ncbi:MAG: calcium-translocating P-type ATPase, PMCA-type [Erysipelotrichaceae bacterium]|jgi:Ca2+-transporting ATPase|nr:calcium-translocating P-type ATPase, PMCA-type [Erysipelotrichaceae bacterium]
MFEDKTKKQLEDELGVDLHNGLSKDEASSRLLKHGLNKLDEKKKKPLILVFFSQFNNPMIYILLASALISVCVSLYSVISGSGEADWIDPIIIMAVVILNSVIGTVQESKAEKSLEALKKLSSPLTIVKRGGVIETIKAEEVVVGDIVILEEGQTVPADLRLIETSNLKTDESSLTGESLPVEKDSEMTFTEEVGVGDRINSAYMGTPVVYGHGEGVVVATGMNTEIGKIATLLSGEGDEQTPLQKKLEKLSKFLGIAVIIIVLIIFAITLIEMAIASKFNVAGVVEAFMLAISIAVAAVPEGLPAVVTIVLALGVQRMVGANTIVRKLPSVETLGAVSVICSDKTGTLTQNKMTVVEAYVPLHHETRKDFNIENLRLLASGMSLCSNASVDNGVHGDPTEIALVEFANSFKLNKKLLEDELPRIDELPFDSVRKMMTTMHKSRDGKIITFTKGAVDNILKYTTHILVDGKARKITKEDVEEISRMNEDMSRRALRVLALATSEDKTEIEETNLTFIGLVAMIDPPRPEAKKAVSILKRAGITTIMITGDHKVTALAIAEELGISDNGEALSGSDIDLLSEEELREKVKTVHVFARVSPENKVSIVKAVKANGNIAAMTGDGVNDAPSLKASDIGIAMGITGTDVAKGAADMVLTDDNFASIEKAVEEGRGIFANIRKTVLFLLSTNIAEVFVMFIAIAAGLPAPLLAIHILWVNLVTDSLPAVALGADEKEKGIMKEKPRNPNESLFSRGGYAITFGYGLVITIVTLFAFLLIPFEHGATSLEAIKTLFETDPEILKQANTAAFCVLAFAELFHMLGMTSIRKSFIHNFKTKNWLIWVAFALGFLLQIAVVEIPGLNEFFKCYEFHDIHWLYIILLSLAPLVVHEVVALILFIKDKIKDKKLTKK